MHKEHNRYGLFHPARKCQGVPMNVEQSSSSANKPLGVIWVLPRFVGATAVGWAVFTDLLYSRKAQPINFGRVARKSETEAKPVGDYVEKNREVPWKVYAWQPDNVCFSHAPHKGLGLEFACFHRDVSNEEQMKISMMPVKFSEFTSKLFRWGI